MKKSRLTVKLSAFTHPAVSKNDHVHIGDILARAKGEEIDEFNLARLLKTSPQKAINYLAVAPGEQLEAGDVIAKKTGFVTKNLVRTPVAGIFTVIDEKRGIVGVKRARRGQDMTAWFEGLIAEVAEDKLVVEVAAQPLAAKAGKGAPVRGKLRVLLEPDLLNLGEIEDCVVTVKTAASALIAKADALGAAAIIAENLEQPPFTLPFLIFTDIAELHPFHDHMVIVRGDERELLVLEDAGQTKVAQKKNK